MKNRIFLVLLTTVILFSIVLTGCEGTSGVAQDVYDQLKEQYENLQKQLSESSTPTATTATTTSAVTDDSSVRIAELEQEIAALKDKYVLEGATKAETAANIVRYYHDTHEYSTTDLFICSDMASEVWNMLKTVDISAVIAVGDISLQVTDIVACTHAWVLAEVEPGQYLALETTGGYAVSMTENPLYYRGWTFSSPATLKSYNEKIREYNTLVVVRNRIATEINDTIALYNAAANQTEADKYQAVYNTLQLLKNEYEAQLTALKNEISGLATPFNQ